MEKVNILMATHNGRLYLRQQLDSILNQTYTDFRLIISDDNSSDSTLKILKEYEEKDNRIEVYGHQDRLGINGNFEFLISKVRSQYFMFADQDDVWNNDKIEKCIKKMEDENCDLVYTDAEVTNSRLKTIESSYWHLMDFETRIKRYNDFESLYLNNFVLGCTMLVKSKWINDCVPFPKSKYIYYDYWIALVISKKGKMGYIDDKTLKLRQHSNNSIGINDGCMKSTLDEERDLLIDIKLDHFNTFKVNDKIFDEKEKALNEKALKFFKSLKEKRINFLNWRLFFKLYKYESFRIKWRDFWILNFPGLAKIRFNKNLKGKIKSK